MSAYSVKIKCGSCERNKSKEFFSKTALSKLADSQRQNARNSKTPIKSINCLACNAGNRDELQCYHCNKTLSLDKFNKTQRRKNDNALCLDCSQERIDREAEHSKEVEEVVIIDDIKRSEAGYQSSRISSNRPSKQASANSRFETDTNPGTNDWFAGNDAVSLASTRSSVHSSAAARPITGTGWDGFTGIDRVGPASRGGSNTGFAKQNAVPRDKVEKAHAQYQREQRRAQEQEEVVRDESDESDDDDDDDPY